MVSIISSAQEIDIEQEVIVEILNSVLQKRGSEKDFAKRVGISPVYLSYVRGYRSVPRMRTAERIAHALPLAIEQQDAWLYHVQRISELKRHVHIESRHELCDQPINELVDEIKQTLRAASFTREPSIAKSRYHQVKISCELLIPFIDPNRDPINYIDLCILMYEALSVLNRNDEGLWCSKRARLVSESIDDPRLYHINQEQLDFMRMNATLAEAVSYHNLKLNRDSYRLCQMVEASDAFRRKSLFWIPHLYRDMINALEGIPRSSITLAENMADQVWHICEMRADLRDELLSLLISGSLARVYIKHCNFKNAYKVLTTSHNRLYQSSQIGTLHQVIFLRSFARFYSKQGDYGDEWKYFIQEALRIAYQAGLEHQLHEMCMEFSNHLGNTISLYRYPKERILPESFQQRHMLYEDVSILALSENLQKSWTLPETNSTLLATKYK